MISDNRQKCKKITKKKTLIFVNKMAVLNYIDLS